MRLNNYLPYLLLSFLPLLAHANVGATDSLFEEGSHCVAYKAQRTQFFVSSSAVIGKNCDVSAQVLPELGGLYHIEVTIPIRSFQSGDADRDESVMKTLKADVRPELVFRTKSMTPDQWHELFSKTTFPLEGDLTIGEHSYPIKVQSKYLQTQDSAEVDGVAVVKFKDFAIDPPSIAGGIFTKAKPQFELHFHFMSNRILGADSIRLTKKEEEPKK